MAYQVVMVAHGWALKLWALRQAMTLDEYVAQTIELFLHGALTAAGWRQWQKRNLEKAVAAVHAAG